jgi:hypothetical protein
LFGVEGRRAEDVIHELRSLSKTDLDGVVAVALSHSKACGRVVASHVRKGRVLTVHVYVRAWCVCVWGGGGEQLTNRNALVLALLEHVNADRVATGQDGAYTPPLRQLADLQGSKFAKVSALARGRNVSV